MSDPTTPARPASEKPVEPHVFASPNVKKNNPTGIEVGAKVAHKDSNLTAEVGDGPWFRSGTYIFTVILESTWENKSWPLEKITLLKAAPPRQSKEAEIAPREDPIQRPPTDPADPRRMREDRRKPE